MKLDEFNSFQLNQSKIDYLVRMQEQPSSAILKISLKTTENFAQILQLKDVATLLIQGTKSKLEICLEFMENPNIQKDVKETLRSTFESMIIEHMKNTPEDAARRGGLVERSTKVLNQLFT